MSRKSSIIAAIMPFCRKFTPYLLALALPMCLWLAASAEEIRFERVNCPFQHPTAQCGMAHLPENREGGSGEVRVFIAILGAENDATPAVVLGGGGPGGDLNLREPGYINYWDDYRQQILGHQGRLILMDQRGSGISQPQLSCPEEKKLFAEILEQPLSSKQEYGLYLPILHECLSRLRADGIQVTAYTTAAAADDVEDIRRLLDIEQWHLIGGSYGTRLALEVMRRHPQGVASALLDSSFPYDSWQHEPLYPFAATLEKIAADCAQQARCRQHGDVIANIDKAMQLAAQVPLILHSNYDGETYHIALTPDRLLALLHTGVYDREIVKKLPSFISQLSRGDTDNEDAHYFAFGYLNFMLSDWANMLYYTINCQEDPVQIPSLTSPLEYYEHDYRQAFLHACDSLWNIQPSSLPTVSSDKPVLLINGVYDHVTPSQWAQHLAKRLPNAQHIVLPDAHSPSILTETTCLQRAARIFFQSPTTAVSHFCDDETLIFD